MEPEPRSSSQRQGQKKKRSRFGCNTCRSRKVKCDERPNGCANCERLHLECTGYARPATRSSISDQSSTTSRRSSRRTYRSCNGCRVTRCKCSGERPVCKRCREGGVRCSYQDELKGNSKVTAPSSEGQADPENMLQSWTTSQASLAHSSGQGSATIGANPCPPWLCAPELPDLKQVRMLVNHYFHNVHPLRCYAFIHRPTFLRRLDNDLSSADLKNNALLHIMCALGAQFYALEYSDTVQVLSAKTILMAGCHWARMAQRILFDNLDKVSTEYLMTAQLLYDHALRMANFTQAFMLGGIMARMAQALQINLEYSVDLLGQSPEADALSVTTRECRRRLMWSCYVTDAICGSGVDQLTLIHERDIKIQLPCKERSFLHEYPSITRTLQGPTLPFVPQESIPADLDDNVGILAYFVQHMEIRRRVLRYIKHLDEAKLPWLPDSEYALLDQELQTWYESLPDNLKFTPAAIYIREESSQLGALCLLHCAFHQTLCDLYRLGTPALYKLRSAFQFPLEQAEFQKELQWKLFKAARTLAAIIAEAERHGPHVIGDTWLPTIAYDSNRIMLYYLTQLVDPTDQPKKQLVIKTIPYLQSNVKALKAMMATNAVADGLAHAAEAMLEKLGVDSNSIRPWPSIVLDDPYLAVLDPARRTVPGTPAQTAPDYVLNPLSIYRMARNDIPERHAPENTISPSAHTQSPEEVARIAPTFRNTPIEEGRTTPDTSLYETADDFEHSLDMFFMPDLAWDWQPAEMVLGSGMESEGLLPWVGTSQLNDFGPLPHQFP